MSQDPLHPNHKVNGHMSGTDTGAIGVQAIGNKGLTLLCPKCKSILTEFKALGRFVRTLNGEVWYECRGCGEYDFKFDKEDVSDKQKPLEYRMPVKPLSEDFREKPGPGEGAWKCVTVSSAEKRFNAGKDSGLMFRTDPATNTTVIPRDWFIVVFFIARSS